jgi:uncharacterized membrane protein
MKRLKKLLKKIRKNPQLSALGIIVFLFILYYSIASYARYDNFHTGRYDLGNMTQTVWNTAHGRIFEMTDPEGQEIVSRLAFHADFILILFAPVYLLWESPVVLLLAQSVIVGLGAIFLYLISDYVLKNKNVSLALAFAYLINPALSWSVLFDFHPVTLATTFLLAAVYFFLKKNYKFFLCFALLAALTKEQVWFIIALFGPLIFFFHKKRLLGFLVFAVPLIIFYMLVWHIMPYAAGSNEYFGLSYFNDENASATGILKDAAMAPDKTYAKIIDEERSGYLKALFAPLGYLPLIFPFWLVFASADILLNLLSDKEELHFIYYHYTATITPFLFLCAIYAIRFIKIYIKEIYIISYIAFFSLFGASTYGPLPGSLDPSVDTIDSFVSPLPYKEEIKSKLSEIPANKSIAVPNNLGGFMSHREKIYNTSIDLADADYIAFLLRTKEIDKYSVDLIKDLRKDENFKIWYDKYGLTIFRKVK